MPLPPAPLAHIVIVEDDAELRDRILVPGLADFGFDTAGVESGAALYRRMLSQPVDLVVLDIGLPYEDGFSIARHLREARAMSIGIVMLTGRHGARDQVRGLSDGADAYLSKAVELDVLAATLHSLLRRMRSPAIAPLPTTGPPDWRLESDGWCLRAPRGVPIALTLPERRLLQRVFAERGEPVARATLIAELVDDVASFDPHRLEMLVHRLRKKVDETAGEALPLRSARNSGYVFAA